jgi:DNA-binding CsgD family transcriptional regulator
MDWSAVALLLTEKAELPVVILSEDGNVMHVAPAAQKALGCGAALIGKNWVEQQGTAEAVRKARDILSKALTGATHRLEVLVPGVQGASIASFESYPIGHGVGRGVLLYLLKVTLAADDSPIRDFDVDYEVEAGADGRFELRSLQRWGRPSIAADGACFQVLHGRASPCESCPVTGLRAAGDVRARARRRGDGDVDVFTATLLEQGHVRVSVRRLSKATFPALLEAKLEELGERAHLSDRERQVLDLLVDGRSFEDIGEALNITARTVKYHQGRLLSKLGADSRSDLMRLLF